MCVCVCVCCGHPIYTGRQSTHVGKRWAHQPWLVAQHEGREEERKVNTGSIFLFVSLFSTLLLRWAVSTAVLGKIFLYFSRKKKHARLQKPMSKVRHKVTGLLCPLSYRLMCLHQFYTSGQSGTFRKVCNTLVYQLVAFLQYKKRNKNHKTQNTKIQGGSASRSAHPSGRRLPNRIGIMMEQRRRS